MKLFIKTEFFQAVFFFLATIALMWLITMTALPFVVNGFFYHIDSPVTIAKITPGSVLLGFSRYARMPMTAVYTQELQCDILYQFEDTVGVLEAGENIFVSELPLPKAAHGACRYRGVVTYHPFGLFGPPFTTAWESKIFHLDD